MGMTDTTLAVLALLGLLLLGAEPSSHGFLRVTVARRKESKHLRVYSKPTLDAERSGPLC